MSRKLACGCAYNNVERVASCQEHANDPALPLLNELRLIERQLEASHEELCIRTMEKYDPNAGVPAIDKKCPQCGAVAGKDCDYPDCKPNLITLMTGPYDEIYFDGLGFAWCIDCGYCDHRAAEMKHGEWICCGCNKPVEF